MFLQRLVLTNFKNYDETELEFSRGINCFVGDNGVGKTNILDAIHYLSLTKSYFSSVDGVNVKHGNDYFIIKGEFISGEDHEEIYCGFQKDRRKILRRNGKEYSRLADHIGRFPVVMISPADSTIITGGSDERRKFMNNVISQYNRTYLNNVIRYNKALKTRNKMLKSSGLGAGFDKDVLRIWEEQMSGPAQSIFDERSDFIEKIVPVFQLYYDHISEKREKVLLEYKSQLFEKSFEELLKESFRKDMILQYTSSGIHRDDLNLEMGAYPIKDLGSQGQQKSFLVALKLAKFDYIMSSSGKQPILLMDDIFDKFDEKRVSQIIKLVSDSRFGQIFITDTHQDRLRRILDEVNIEYRLFRINNGIEEVISNGKKG